MQPAAQRYMLLHRLAGHVTISLGADLNLLRWPHACLHFSARLSGSLTRGTGIRE
jgi:hypothetical protein